MTQLRIYIRAREDNGTSKIWQVHYFDTYNLVLWLEETAGLREKVYMTAKLEETYVYKPGNIFYAHDEHESMAEYHVTGNPLQMLFKHAYSATKFSKILLYVVNKL